MVLAAVLSLAPSAWCAEEPNEVSLDEARAQLEAIQKKVSVADNDRDLSELRVRALALQAKMNETGADLAPRVAQLAARIAELGVRQPGEPESSDVSAQREELERQHTALEGEFKLAGLLSLEADQVLTLIGARSRERFRERLTDRVRSPVERRFWADLAADLPDDVRQARAFALEMRRLLGQASLGSLGGALIIMAVTLFARWRLMVLLRRLAVKARLRRSLRALAHIALWTLSTALISASVLIPVTSGDELPSSLTGLFAGLAATVTFGAYVASLGTALLAARAPTWRLPPIPDAVASTLSRFSVRLALVIVIVAVVEQLTTAMALSLSSSVALELLLTLVLSLTLARGLRHGLRAQARSAAQLPLWLRIIGSIGWIMIVSAALCALAGYVALGSFITRETAWAAVVLCSAYLVSALVDDVLKAFVLPADRSQTHITVLLSALTKLTIGVLAAFLLLAPYAPGAIDLVPQLHRAQQGISIGAVLLRPGALLRGLAVLVVGSALVALTKRWMAKRYLPATRMDEGMRDSVTSLAGYIGYIVVFSIALSAAGVSLQQIAWVASALALGIGFGLQTIVQNFVSGLILLAERPVRVGDWVMLGHVEGDIRRIRARATEIQSIDRSTVIVPNSELITKVVRNVTFANPLGVVQIKLPVPLGTDVERVRAELLEALRRHPDILDVPEPVVMIEGFERGNVLFNATGYVASPRATYRVRSAILFETLTRLNEANITMIGASAVVVPADGSADWHRDQA